MSEVFDVCICIRSHRDKSQNECTTFLALHGINEVEFRPQSLVDICCGIPFGKAVREINELLAHKSHFTKKDKSNYP